jgi:hypothetical protein
MRALILAIVLFPSLAFAQSMKPEAKAHFDKGLQHYANREYEAAIVELDAAYALDPRPEILFANAQAERLSGDCASAVVLYRRFLESNPPAVHADAARANLDKCQTALSSKPEGEAPAEEQPPPETPPDQPAPAAVEPPQVPAEPPPEPPPWYTDKLGGALLGGGVVVVGVSAFLFMASSDDADSAATAPTYSEYQELADRAESRRTWSLVGFGVGAGLLAGAALRYGLSGDAGEPERVTASFSFTPGGGTVVLGSTF